MRRRASPARAPSRPARHLPHRCTCRPRAGRVLEVISRGMSHPSTTVRHGTGMTTGEDMNYHVTMRSDHGVDAGMEVLYMRARDRAARVTPSTSKSRA